MVKKGRNIFDYYRGPEVTDSEVERVKTLENNATKALINTLENSSEKLTRELFKEESGIKLEGELSYFLQTEPQTIYERVGEEELDIKEVYVIGISEKEKRKTDDSSDSEIGDESTPDALIQGNEKLIAIEAKTGSGKLKDKQLEKHLKNCEKRLKPNKSKIEDSISWGKLSEVMEEFRDQKKKNDKEFFLINEFIEFLEVNNMTKFKSFDEDLLTTGGRNKALKEQLFELTERLRKNLPDEFGLNHTSTTDGRGKNNWDYLSPRKMHDKETGTTRRDIPHISLSLQTDKFEIKIHVGGEVDEAEHLTYLYNLTDQEIDSLVDYLKRIYTKGFSFDEIVNKDSVSSWYEKGKRPIRLVLHGRRGAMGSFPGLKGMWRLKRERGIYYKKDIKYTEDFLQSVFDGIDDGTKHHFQIKFEYPYSSSGTKDSTDILTGEVGREFYEEAYEAIENLYPIFKHINEKSLEEL